MTPDLAIADDSVDLPLALLMNPIEPSAPAGVSLRASALYRGIELARSADDASLPMGQMPHELKRADWPAVQRMCVDALCHHSKDLQLAVWLQEALMQQRGLAGLAPGLRFTTSLLDAFWDCLHPADIGHRANLLRWVNRRLLLTLKLIPLNCDSEAAYAWADLELAQRLAQQATPDRKADDDSGDGDADLQALHKRLAATPTPVCRERLASLGQALQAVAELNTLIDRRFDDDAPSLGNFARTLESIQGWFTGELRRRGQPFGVEPPAPASPAASPGPAAAHTAPALAAPQPVVQAQDARSQAYAMLASASEILLRIEPHSPVPYIVQRAVAWGSLNTAELYRELFLRTGGQINIFELLGIQEGEAPAASAA